MCFISTAKSVLLIKKDKKYPISAFFEDRGYIIPVLMILVISLNLKESV